MSEITETEAQELERAFNEIMDATIQNVTDMSTELRRLRKNGVLHFGNGDLAVGVKRLPDKKVVGLVIVDALGDDRTVGSLRDYTPQEQKDNIKAVWRFENVQSIDVVIAKLQQARQMLEAFEQLEKLEKIEPPTF